MASAADVWRDDRHSRARFRAPASAAFARGLGGVVDHAGAAWFCVADCPA